MKTKFLTAVAILMAVLVAGCRKSEFSVEMRLPADVGKTYTLAYYASDGSKGWMIETVVAVQKGVGKLQGATRRPTLLYVMTSGGRLPSAVAYVERGDRIEMEGSTGDPMDWKISGNKLTEQLSDWRLSNIDAIRKAKEELPESSKGLNSAVAASVKKSPGEALSALLLYVYYDRREDPAGFTALRKLLKDDAAEPEWAELASRSDMVGDPAGGGKVPETLVLRTVQSGCDTLSLRGLPTLIYYSQRSREDYQESVKLLRELTREYPDSGKRRIVNVSIDPDSVSYVNSWQRDSLKATVIAWAPLGLSDETAQKAGVRRIPWVLVVDSKGKAAYSGQDMEKGIEAIKGMLSN